MITFCDVVDMLSNQHIEKNGDITHNIFSPGCSELFIYNLWKQTTLESNANITNDDVKNYLCCYLRYNSVITDKVILMHPSCTLNLAETKTLSSLLYYYHNLEYLSSNPNLTLEFINKHPNVKYPTNMSQDGPHDGQWNWARISKNPAMTIDIIKSNRHLPWDWNCILYNPNITKDIVGTFDGPDWNQLKHYFGHTTEIHKWEHYKNSLDKMQSHNWMLVSKYENVPLQTIFDTPDGSLNNNLPKWDWRVVSCREDVTFEIIMSNKHLPWNWKYVSINPNITWEIIMANKRIPWHWSMISGNCNITPTIIARNIEKPWSLEMICRNPMDYPYYKNEKWKKQLANKTASIIYEELIARVRHSSRHRANWMSIEEYCEASSAPPGWNEGLCDQGPQKDNKKEWNRSLTIHATAKINKIKYV